MRKRIFHAKKPTFQNLPLFFFDGFELCINLQYTFHPLPDDKISDWSKLRQIADDILKCI